MNGPAHYKEAERLLTAAERTDNALDVTRQFMTQCAQVHATLALAAATVDAAYGNLAVTADEAWIEARSDHG